jgi:hypothetical protein
MLIDQQQPRRAIMQAPCPTRYPVIELRRYTIAEGGRQRFARYFETYFPEAFQQLGAAALGHFCERERSDHFTWLRGYPDMQARAAVNHAFYDGPVWREHRALVNGYIVDSDNVLLLRPLYPDSDIPALRAVDPVAEPMGAQGVAVAQIFKAAPGMLDACALAAESWFVNYRGRGVIEAGILVTLDEPNNFPRHPIRTDGSWLVWLGVLRDEAALDELRPLFATAAIRLAETGLLDGPAELVVLDPCRRSRLRWVPALQSAMASAA